jgi:hypothetical protein
MKNPARFRERGDGGERWFRRRALRVLGNG